LFTKLNQKNTTLLEHFKNPTENHRLWCLTQHSTIFQLYRVGPVLLVEETGENHRPVTDKLDHIKLYRVHLAMSGNQTHNFSGDSL
jgi:hypothetical protein